MISRPVAQERVNRSLQDVKGIDVPRKPTLDKWLRNKWAVANKTRQQIADPIDVSYASIHFLGDRPLPPKGRIFVGYL